MLSKRRSNATIFVRGESARDALQSHAHIVCVICGCERTASEQGSRLDENNAQIGMLGWGQGPALSWFTFAAANSPACNWTQHIAELTATPNAYEQW